MRLLALGLLLAGCIGSASDDDDDGFDAPPGSDPDAPLSSWDGPRPDAAPPGVDAAGCTAGVEPCEFLAAHNQVRCEVDPPAASMPRMTWDEALECVAQQWANTCPDGHNDARTSMYAACGGTGDYVGENMGWGYGSPSAVVSAWASEVVDYDLATNSCSGVCGHYTQIVWANSTRLGCARPEMSCPSWGTAIWVCNYAPGGNYGGQAPYVAGTGPNAACE